MTLAEQMAADAAAATPAPAKKLTLAQQMAADGATTAPAPASKAAPAPAEPKPEHWWQVTPSQQAQIDAQKQQESDGNPGVALAQVGAHAVTSAGSYLAGLARAGGALLGGGNLSDAADEVTQTHDQYTYNPPAGSGGATLMRVAGVPLGALAKGTGYLGDKTLEATGSPALATIADVGTNFAATAGAGKMLGSLVKPKGGAEPAPAPVPPRVEPTMPAPAPPAAPQPLAATVDAAPNLTLAQQGSVPVKSPVFAEAASPPAVAPATASVAPEAAPGYLDPSLQVPAQPPAAVAPPAAPVIPPPQLEHASDGLQLAVARAQEAGTPINPDVLQRHIEADTLPVPIQLTAGQATLDPGAISAEMNSRGGKAPMVSPDFYNTQGRALAQNLDVIRQRAAPDVTATDPLQHGQTLIDQYKAMDAPVQADIAAKYKALEDANGGQFPLDGQALAANTQAALDKALKSSSVPADLQANLDKFDNGRQMTFQDFETMRSDAADAQRNATDGRQRAAAGIVREQLEAMPLTPEAAGLKPLADAARAAAKARFDALDSDPAYKAAVGDGVGQGEASPLADNFVQKYLITAPRANILQMRQNLAGSPLAQQTIPAATVDYLRGKSKADVETGQFNASTYNGVVDKLGPKFDALMDPASAATLQQVGNIAKYTTVQPKGSYVNNSNTLVGMGLDVAKNRIGDALNTATLGATGTIAGIAKGIGQVRAARAATAPGAGITKLSDLAPPPSD